MWLLIPVLIPLHVGTDCRSVLVITGNWQLLTKDCDIGGLAGKSYRWAEMPFHQRCHFSWVLNSTMTHFVLNPDYRETSLINELITEIYILCAKRDVKNFCDDIALAKVLAFVRISSKRHMKKWQYLQRVLFNAHLMSSLLISSCILLHSF